MSYAINPQRIEDEVLERLSYQDNCEVDDFTMKRFYHGLRHTLEHSTFNAETYVALGFVLFNMKKYKEFIEIHDQGKKYYTNNLYLHTHRLLGMLRLVNLKLYDIPNFDLYSLWFDPDINVYDTPFEFVYGSKRLVFSNSIMTLKRDNLAKIALYANRTFSVNFGPIHFIRNYDDMKNDEMFFDESFTWEVIEKIRTNVLTETEDLYIKDILGNNYSDFMNFADPDYSEILNNDVETGEDETYNSVDEFMESLMI